MYIKGKRVQVNKFSCFGAIFVEGQQNSNVLIAVQVNDQ